MSTLSTHVLDAASGLPAAGMRSPSSAATATAGSRSARG